MDEYKYCVMDDSIDYSAVKLPPDTPALRKIHDEMMEEIEKMKKSGSERPRHKE
jgi:hypothetical protein